MTRPGPEAFTVTTQTYPCKQDWLVANALAGIGAVKFAPISAAAVAAIWGMASREKQGGSSAMPQATRSRPKRSQPGAPSAGLPRRGTMRRYPFWSTPTIRPTAVVLPEAF